MREINQHRTKSHVVCACKTLPWRLLSTQWHCGGEPKLKNQPAYVYRCFRQQKLMGKKCCRRPIRILPTQRRTFARLTEHIRGTNYWLQLCKHNQRIRNSPAIDRDDLIRASMQVPSQTWGACPVPWYRIHQRLSRVTWV